MIEKRWNKKSLGRQQEVDALAACLNIDVSISQLLVQRGVHNFDDAKDFFRPDLNKLHSPFEMKDMDKAIERIENAVALKEKILIFGDYDVDGTTAVSLVYSFLKELLPAGVIIDYYIPDRYSEGYGISFKGIDFARENNFKLIIALDCGIKSLDKIDYANEYGVDFIICDHHRPGDELPKASAVLDPKRTDCNYPYKELTGCGIGFKLMQAWCEKHKIDLARIYNYLDLAAVSIAADIVPITGENRILAYHGIKRLNEAPRPGIKAILEVANIKRELSIGDVVFVIGPRINAAGRLETGKKAVELLISETPEEALGIGQHIQKTNVDRQQLDKTITTEALMMIEHNGWQNRKSTVLYKTTWHKGVIGIVASRLTEKYYRPTIMLTSSNGVVTGSARSVKDFDVYEAIEACNDLLVQFGGHKYAAGLTLNEEHVDAFIDKFEKVVSSTIPDELLIPEIEIDAEIHLSDINPKFVRILKQFAPFGPENMNPVFVSRNIKCFGYPKVMGESHLRLDVFQEESPSLVFQAMAFNMADKIDLLVKNKPVDICYAIEENEWNGNKTLRLNIKDIKQSTL